MNIALGRKALVTGAASGIGLEVSRRLARAGASVAVIDVQDEKLQPAAEDLGERAIAIRADVSSASDVRAAVDRTIAAFGGLDTLVLCAGVIHVKRLEEVREDDWDRTLNVNLKGAFLCCQAAAPALKASGRGRIVTISSDAGRHGAPMLHAYCASKFGLIGLTESVAGELAPNVTANCICPIGIPSTGMGQQMLSWKMQQTRRSAADVMASITSGIPLCRPATEGDIADAALFFISEHASFITGVALDVDGGAHIDVIPGSVR